MANMYADKKGCQIIQVSGADGKRKSIRLGKVPKREAERVLRFVEKLQAAQLTSCAPDLETSKWVAELSDQLHLKLCKIGLVAKRQSSIRLEEFVDQYLAGRTDLKQSTLDHCKRAKKNLVEFFGREKAITEITEADSEDYERWLYNLELGQNTVRRRCGRAKQFLNYAMKKGIIRQNPFQHLKVNVGANEERLHFITLETARKVLKACPDNEWRLIFGLARFGGLRCPSEVLSLEWGHVNWEQNKVVVPSPKTEHHPNGSFRVIPLFNELRPYLEAGFDAAEPGDRFVIKRYRFKNSNLRTQFRRILEKGGIEPWGKPFQNLRSTRETELAEQFPAHVVVKWLGNTEAVANKHYFQVNEGHFEKALQNPVQHLHADDGNGLQLVNIGHEKSPELQGFAEVCSSVHCTEAPPVGLEPTT